MVRNQSRSSAGPISTGAQSVHGKSQPKPDSAGPEHILARSPAVVDEVDRGALPAWVLTRAADSVRAGAPNERTEPITSPSSPEFLTVAEAASVLRVSVRTLRRHLAAGKIPHIRVGRQVRILREPLLRGV